MAMVNNQMVAIWGYNGIYNVFWMYFLWASGSCPPAGPTVHTDGNPASARSGGPLWKAEVMVAPKSEGHWEIWSDVPHLQKKNIMCILSYIYIYIYK